MHMVSCGERCRLLHLLLTIIVPAGYLLDLILPHKRSWCPWRLAAPLLSVVSMIPAPMLQLMRTNPRRQIMARIRVQQQDLPEKAGRILTVHDRFSRPEPVSEREPEQTFAQLRSLCSILPCMSYHWTLHDSVFVVFRQYGVETGIL